MIGNLANKVLNRVGYSLVKQKPNLELYGRTFPAESVAAKRFYNVGAGSFFHPCWTNLDFVSEWYAAGRKAAVVPIDLMKMAPLPIPRDSAEVIYTSHTIEHVTDAAVANLFREAQRCLKPGGIFRVTTGPDADSDWEAMRRGDAAWFYWNEWYVKPGSYEHIYHRPATSVPIEERWLHHVASQLAPNDKSPSKTKLNAEAIRKLVADRPKEEVLNYLTSLCEFQPERAGNHVSWWNAAKIEALLRASGFATVYHSGYGQSRCPVLREVAFFDNTHPQISVYVEAVK